MANGTTCCKYYRRKNTGGSCDGGHVNSKDPADCCLEDEVSPCTNEHGGCKDHFDAEGKNKVKDFFVPIWVNIFNGKVSCRRVGWAYGIQQY